MEKAAKILQKLKEGLVGFSRGFKGEAPGAIKHVSKGKAGDEAAAMLKKSPKAARKSQVEREITKAKIDFEAADKGTKVKKLKAEKKHVETMDKIERGVQAAKAKDAGKIDKNKAVNTMAGIGLVGVGTAGYVAKKNHDQRERAITALRQPRSY